MSKDREEKLGKRIKKIREERGLSQLEVAERLGREDIRISRETLSKIENNSRSISAVELRTLCKVLYVDMEDFFYKEKAEGLDSDLITFFRKRNFSQKSLEEISQLQELIKIFIEQEKIYKNIVETKEG